MLCLCGHGLSEVILRPWLLDVDLEIFPSFQVHKISQEANSLER